MENERNLVEYESVLDSIDKWSVDDNSDKESISTHTLEDIRNGNPFHPHINAMDSRLIIRNQIRKSRSEWKVSEITEKIMGKLLHKVFKVIVK